MKYEGYFTGQQILEKIESAFPFIERPSDDDLYVVDEGDLMRRIISSKISELTYPELPYEGVIILYDEFSTLSSKAVEWLFPSLLRILILKKDRSTNLHRFFPFYFEHLDLSKPDSAYNFSWLTRDQILVLSYVLDHLSEEYGDSTGFAHSKLQLLMANNK